MFCTVSQCWSFWQTEKFHHCRLPNLVPKQGCQSIQAFVANQTWQVQHFKAPKYRPGKGAKLPICKGSNTASSHCPASLPNCRPGKVAKLQPLPTCLGCKTGCKAASGRLVRAADLQLATCLDSELQSETRAGWQGIVMLKRLARH